MKGQDELDEKVIKYIGEKEHDEYLKEFSTYLYQHYSEGLSNKDLIEKIRKYRNEHKIYLEGDKIKLIKMDDKHTELKPGATGYITGFGDIPLAKELQIWINWESGSNLGILIPVDEIEIIEVG